MKKQKMRSFQVKKTTNLRDFVKYFWISKFHFVVEVAEVAAVDAVKVEAVAELAVVGLELHEYPASSENVKKPDNSNRCRIEIKSEPTCSSSKLFLSNQYFS